MTGAWQWFGLRLRFEQHNRNTAPTRMPGAVWRRVFQRDGTKLARVEVKLALKIVSDENCADPGNRNALGRLAAVAIAFYNDCHFEDPRPVAGERRLQRSPSLCADLLRSLRIDAKELVCSQPNPFVTTCREHGVNAIWVRGKVGEIVISSLSEKAAQ